MALKTKVKAGNITSLSDARYCSGMGVDFLGFPVGTDTATHDLKRFKEIRSWISGPATVLELASLPTPQVLNDIHELNAGFLEINTRILENLTSAGIPLMVTMSFNEWEAVRPLLLKNRATIAYLVLTSDRILSTADLTPLASDFSILLTLEGQYASVTDFLILPVAGVAISGSPEERPGLKGYESLADVLEKLEIDE